MSDGEQIDLDRPRTREFDRTQMRADRRATTNLMLSVLHKDDGIHVLHLITWELESNMSLTPLLIVQMSACRIHQVPSPSTTNPSLWNCLTPPPPPWQPQMLLKQHFLRKFTLIFKECAGCFLLFVLFSSEQPPQNNPISTSCNYRIDWESSGLI